MDTKNYIDNQKAHEEAIACSHRTQPTKGFWTMENIAAAKRLVREITAMADSGRLSGWPNDVDVLVAKARELMGAVHSNKPAGDIVLPL